jgi:hypothetical protein
MAVEGKARPGRQGRARQGKSRHCKVRKDQAWGYCN